jgi:hypothetical protein
MIDKLPRKKKNYAILSPAASRKRPFFVRHPVSLVILLTVYMYYVANSVTVRQKKRHFPMMSQR